MKKIYKMMAVIAVIAVAGVTIYNPQGKRLHLSGIALKNIEALASGESGSGYCTMHIACFDKYGNMNGNYSASSYTGPGYSGPYHSHSCSSCNSI